MKTVPEHTNNSINWFLNRVVEFCKALYLYLFWIVDELRKFIRDHYKEKKSPTWRLAYIITIILMLYLIYSAWNSIYTSVERQRNKGYYEKALLDNSKKEVREFFDKYNERYEAHDCWFMRKVAADEAMYDKRGKIEYAENEYPCEWFFTNKSKKLISVENTPIKQVDWKYYVEWDLITLIEDAYWKYGISFTKYKLFKALDRDLWHFVWDLKWIGPTHIEFYNISN